MPDDQPRAERSELSRCRQAHAGGSASSLAHQATGQTRDTHRWPTGIAVLIVVMIAFAAAVYGGVEAWSELVLLAASGPLAVYALFEAARRGLGRHAAILIGLLVAYAGLAVVQLVPLPLVVLAWLSPARWGVLTRLLDPPPGHAPLSYYPAETIASLRLLFIAASVFGAAAALSRSTTAVKGLLYGLAFVGTAEAGLAVAQVMSDAEGIYWSELSTSGAWTGSFVNHSNFAQFINLTLGASLACFLTRLRADQERNRTEPTNHSKRLENFFNRYGIWLVAFALQAVAIAVSLSRAGLLGMVIAATLTCLVLRRTSRLGQSVWTLAIAPPIAFVLLLLLGLDAVFLRVETLQESTSYADRVRLGLCTLRAGWDHLVFGTGLGTHAAVFPAYDTTGSVAVAEQADNDYAQLFEEMGGLGVLLASGMVVTLFAAVRAVLSQRLGPLRYPAYGAIYGLLAIAVQSWTDFGQRVPAVFCVTAALAGVLTGLITNGVGRDARRRPLGWLGTLAWAVAAGIGWVGLLKTGVTDFRASEWRAIAETATQRLGSVEPEAIPQLHLDRIAAMERATSLQPDRVELTFWLNAYRWEAVQLAAMNAESVATVDIGAAALRVVEDLGKARRIAPTYGPVYTLEGQLRLATGDPSGGGLLREGVRLTPNDPIACYATAAYLLRQEGDDATDQEAYGLLRRAVELDRSLFDDAIGVLIESRGAINVAIELAGDEPTRLRALADRVEEVADLADQAQPLREKALFLQRQRVELPTASVGEMVDLGTRLSKAGDLEGAAALLKRASSLDFANRRLRFRLIDVLTELGRYEEALRETEIAVRMQPQNAAVKQRLNRLLDLIESQEASESVDEGSGETAESERW